MPFAAAAQRVVLAERISGELVRHEDAPQIGVAAKSNAIHVENLSLHPVRPRPDWDGGGEGRIGVVHPALDHQSPGGIEVLENVVHLETGSRPPGVSQIVRRSQFGKELEAALALEHAQQFDQPRPRHEKPQVVAKSRCRKHALAKPVARVARVAEWFIVRPSDIRCL